MKTIYTILGFILIGANLMDPQFCSADDAKPTWSIAIHGGAGSDPTKWDQSKVEARKRGLERALRAGCDSLSIGGTALDTVEIVIRVLEDDAVFNAGRGAVVTQEGRAELDASIMDGKTAACGAVAGVTTVKNPISLARRVMTETKHVLLSSSGADAFAKAQQVELVEPSYFLSYQKHLRERQAALAGNSSEPQATADDTPHFGTVGCVVLDSAGNLAAGTSTGGTSKKLPGRIGDSPIIGAGTYAANDSCAVSGTGVGEEYIRHSVAYDVAAQMRYLKRSLPRAVSEIMRNRLEAGVGGVIAVSKEGEIVLQHNTPGMSCGAADSNGRFETHLILERGGEPDAKAPSVEDAITKLIQEQVDHWNAADIDGFMSLYWKSDELTFCSGGKITRGFDATLARYKQHYPDADAMGEVTLDKLEFLTLSPNVTQVLGHWQLARDEETMGGRFTLVFRRFSDGWKIVHDHTSKLPSEDSQP